MNDKLKILYDRLKESGLVDNLPDHYEVFKNAMLDPQVSQQFYDNLSKSNVMDNLPQDYNTFEEALGLKKKDVSTQDVGVLQKESSPQKSDLVSTPEIPPIEKPQENVIYNAQGESVPVPEIKAPQEESPSAQSLLDSYAKSREAWSKQKEDNSIAVDQSLQDKNIPADLHPAVKSLLDWQDTAAVPSEDGDKKKTSLVYGTVKEIYQSFADELRNIHKYLNTLDDATYGVGGFLLDLGTQSFLPGTTPRGDKLRELFLKAATSKGEDKKKYSEEYRKLRDEKAPMLEIADKLDNMVANNKDLPDTYLGNMLKTGAHLVPLITELSLTPEVRLASMPEYFSAIPKLVTLEGTRGFLNGLSDAKDKKGINAVAEPFKKMGIGVMNGYLMHGLGMTSGLLGNAIGEATLSRTAGVASSSLLAGLGFGSYDVLNKWAQTGKFDLKESAGGMAFSILGIPSIAKAAGIDYSRALVESATRRALGNTLSADPMVMRGINNMKIDPIKMRQQAIDIAKKIKDAKTPEEKNNLVRVLNTINNVLDINAGTQLILRDPDGVKRYIQQRKDLSDQEKTFLTGRVTDIAAENDPYDIGGKQGEEKTGTATQPTEAGETTTGGEKVAETGSKEPTGANTPESIAKELGISFIGNGEGYDMYNVDVNGREATFSVPEGSTKDIVDNKRQETVDRFKPKEGGKENAGRTGEKITQAGEQAQKLEQEKKGRLRVRNDVQAGMAQGKGEGRGGGSQNGGTRNEVIPNELNPFVKIINESESVSDAFAKAKELKDIPADVSRRFRERYDPENKLTPKQVFEKFYNDVKAIQEKSQKPKAKEERNIDLSWLDKFSPMEEVEGGGIDQLTKDEYLNQVIGDYLEKSGEKVTQDKIDKIKNNPNAQIVKDAIARHWEAIKMAEEEGKTGVVPDKVLKDYPDLFEEWRTGTIEGTTKPSEPVTETVSPEEGKGTTKETKAAIPSQNAPEGTVLSVKVPGAGAIVNFMSRDILPKIKNLKPYALAAKKMIVDWVRPPESAEIKQRTQIFLRQMKANTSQFKDQLWSAAEKRRAWWSGINEEAQLDFIDKAERGKTSKKDFSEYGKEISQLFSDIASEYRDRLEKAYADAKSYNDKIGYIENYFPHIWEKPKEAERFVSNYIKKMGKPAFMKNRYWDFVKEGMKSGLKLKTTNPEENVVMREISGYQYKELKNFLDRMKDNGWLKFKRGLKKPPPGWSALDKNVLKVYFPTEKGLVQAGEWIMPDPAARVVNKYLSPSLWSKEGFVGSTFRNFMRAKNTLVTIKLGLSAFHVVETTNSDIATSLTLFLKRASRGDVKGALKQLAITPISPILSLQSGDIINAWEKGAKNAWQQEAVDLIKRGGGRPTMSKEWKIQTKEQWNRALDEFRKGNPIGGTLRVIPHILQAIQKPIMEYYVPRLKVSNYLRMAKDYIEAHPGIKEEELDTYLTKAWDSVDNRFGQLVYDNLFWDRWVRDLGVASSLSMGWNLGTIREFGGGAMDFSKMITRAATKTPPKIFADRMLYSITYPLVFGTLGALMTYIATKKKPEELLDYFYPKTGNKKLDGTDERLQMPTMMKEFFAFKAALRKYGLIKGSGVYLWHKINPLISIVLDILENKSFYGVEIRDPNAPAVEQAKQLAVYLGTEGAIPISISAYLREKDMIGNASLRSFLGFVPAPRYVTETPMQTKIYATYNKREGAGVKTQEQQRKAQVKSEIRRLYLEGKDEEMLKKLKEATDKGDLKQVTAFLRDSNLPSDIRTFQSLPKSDQRGLLKEMKKDDYSRYAPYANDELKKELNIKLEKPNWYRQRIVSKGASEEPQSFSNELKFWDYKQAHPEQFDELKKKGWIPDAYTRKKYTIPGSTKSIEFSDAQLQNINKRALELYEKKMMASKDYYSKLSKDLREKKSKLIWGMSLSRAKIEEYKKQVAKK